MDQTQPFIRFEMVFPKAYKIHKLIKIMLPPEHLKWAKNTIFEEIIDCENNHPCMGYLHAGSKKQFGISPRDWFDKWLRFEHNERIYSY